VLQARQTNPLDAEVILDLVEIYLLEKKINKAKTMLKYYHKNIKKIQTFDKSKEYYDHKMDIFSQYIITRENDNKIKNKKF
jgi:CII-binding regulator of phage lambda lysogenization HflD